MGTPELWDLVVRPVNAVQAAEIMLGISPSAARLLASALHATSPEADALLFAVPRMMRSLVIATTIAPERCHGEVRGPIQWGETMSARAANAGDPMVFVCASPGRAYDAPENRVLVAALESVRAAAAAVEVGRLKHRDTALFHHIRANGSQARRFLEHRSLNAIPRVKPQPRDLKRARSGTRRRNYGPALLVLDRVGEGFSGDDLELVADEATATEHDVVVEAVRHLRAAGHPIPGFRVRGGALVAGPLSYRHHRTRHPELPGGLAVDGMPVEAARPDEVAGALRAVGW
ncbi:MAG: hypothetical protein QOG03_2643 [Actinomycetota bacterium]|nr:hypothetical protein [Actinomycetota bacterium]